MRWLNRLIERTKGEQFKLDCRIPKSYLMQFVLAKLFQLLYGALRLQRLIYLHHTATVKCKQKLTSGKNLRIDRGCYIDALSSDGITFGDNVSIGKMTTIECTGSLKDIGKGLSVGNNVGLGTHGFFGCAGGIEIGNDTIFGNYVSLHAENHNYADPNTPIRQQGVNRKGIRIGSNCWIGAKATILDGTILGDGCIVAAGAVVSGTFANDSIVGGVPARFIKSRI